MLASSIKVAMQPLLNPWKIVGRLRSKNRYIFNEDLEQQKKESNEIMKKFPPVSADETDEKVIAAKIEQMNKYISSIDTTLTPEKRAHVEKLKKKMKGGPKSPRSLFRDVPTPDEISPTGNYMTKIVENPEALIDFALSHIPEKTGRRGSRQKRRMALRFQRKRDQHAEKKKQLIAANLRKQAKGKKQRQLVAMYKKMGAEIRVKMATSKL